jgi:hypothetical protein
MRIVFLFLWCTVVSGCAQDNPSRVAPAGDFESIAAERATERRAQERLEELFPAQREMNWHPNTVVNPYPQLTEFSDDVDSHRRGP